MLKYEQFRLASDKIARAYESLGHSLGWRFLTSPSATFNESQEILLLTMNPAGDRDYPEHPRESCEAGSAYIVESWDNRPAGEARMQRQVRALFAELAKRINGGSGDCLLGNSLSAHFVPFRSANFDALHEKEKSVAFARELWSEILRYIRPIIVITLSRENFDALMDIESELPSGSPEIDNLPVGWGQYNSTVARFSNGPVICRFPHLSRFSVFGRKESAVQIREIMDLIAVHYNDLKASTSNAIRQRGRDVPSISDHDALQITSMNKIYVIAQPSTPFRKGTLRRRAWHLLQAYDGLSVQAFIQACALMESATGTGGDPKGWVKFFTSTGRYSNQPGSPNFSEKLAEIR